MHQAHLPRPPENKGEREREKGEREKEKGRKGKRERKRKKRKGKREKGEKRKEEKEEKGVRVRASGIKVDHYEHWALPCQMRSSSRQRPNRRDCERCGREAEGREVVMVAAVMEAVRDSGGGKGV
jgi:hypothetical protein